MWLRYRQWCTQGSTSCYGSLPHTFNRQLAAHIDQIPWSQYEQSFEIGPRDAKMTREDMAQKQYVKQKLSWPNLPLTYGILTPWYDDTYLVVPIMDRSYLNFNHRPHQTGMIFTVYYSCFLMMLIEACQAPAAAALTDDNISGWIV